MNNTAQMVAHIPAQIPHPSGNIDWTGNSTASDGKTSREREEAREQNFIVEAQNQTDCASRLFD